MKREPVLIGAIAQIAVVAAAAFGLELDEPTVVSAVAGVMALIAIVQRAMVSPVVDDG